jgi:hypothetical protein
MVSGCRWRWGNVEDIVDSDENDFIKSLHFNKFEIFSEANTNTAVLDSSVAN